MKKLLPIVVIAAGCAVAISVVMIARSGVTSAQQSSEPYPAPDTHFMQTYQTVEEAQAIVGFDVRTLAIVPVGFNLASVSVNSRPSLGGDGNIITVEVLYRATGGRMLSLTQRNAEFRHSVTDGTTIDIAGKSVYIATETNAEGAPVGIVSWEADNLTFLLAQNGIRGEELAILVESVR
jgi:hypothetical protein